jgi:hypothetical protein
VDAALAEDEANVACWALAEIVYRATGDPRGLWLSGQPGLIGTFDLTLSETKLAELRALLLRLHANSFVSAGRSVRDGTQTRGWLFNRQEPELARLRAGIEQAIGEYVAQLPPFDPTHPLLRHRREPMTILGSWSVRLTGGGRHVTHFHPEGLISSACYLIVPEGIEETGEGWLELGRPPSEYGLDLEPLATVVPRPGAIALFPSYLHHGTRPFSAGERMTVAFDVVAAARR